jgi:DNA-binding NtrC family response regulator
MGVSIVSKRVLVVEDERGIRVLVAAILRQKGCIVVEAGNGREALNILKHDSKFDVVLTDLKMPELNGVALVGEIQARYPHIRIVIMSAYFAEDWANEVTKDSIVSLSKPFTHTQLVDTLAEVLQR